MNIFYKSDGRTVTLSACADYFEIMIDGFNYGSIRKKGGVWQMLKYISGIQEITLSDITNYGKCIDEQLSRLLPVNGKK